MRCWLLVFALAACSHASTGPAWPKSTAAVADGGESLAPRPSAHELAAPEANDEVAVAPAPAAPIKAAPAATSEPAPAATTPTEETITTEEITIEIDDE
ncbi:MAG TPA: hypothetical protein VH143_05420 [Kofleriaceae bacterium]|jgi:hypothetical protein|nr:hypothetical protein [Kofleriaceae bacterium]